MTIHEIGSKGWAVTVLAIALASLVHAQSPAPRTLTADTPEAVMDYLSKHPTAAMKSMPELIVNPPSFSRSRFSDTTYRIDYRLGFMAVENVRVILTVRRGTLQFTIREEPPGPLKMAPVPQGASRIPLGEAVKAALAAGTEGRQTRGWRQGWWWTPSGLRHAFIVTTGVGTPPRDDIAQVAIDAYTGEVLK